jgi:hypothetical protein
LPNQLLLSLRRLRYGRLGEIGCFGFIRLPLQNDGNAPVSRSQRVTLRISRLRGALW